MDQRFPITKHLNFEDLKNHRTGYITIIGRPNVGKSTLLNALLSQKLSIVDPKAQTTRNCIKGIVSNQNFQMIIQDTPGIISKYSNCLEKNAMSTLNKSVYYADCILALIDASKKLEEAAVIMQIKKSEKLPRICIIVNKIDTIPIEERAILIEYIQKLFNQETIIACSAEEKFGIEQIRSWSVLNLPKSPPLYPKEFIASQPQRFFISEQVREKILEYYSQEIPYSCQVNVVEFVKRSLPKKSFTSVEIWVENIAQKKILIGSNGQMIAILSKASRVAIEKFLNIPIYLEIRVKVRTGWLSNDRITAKLGY